MWICENISVCRNFSPFLAFSLFDFKYLGARIASSLSDFRQQRGVAWSNFWKLETIWRSTSLPLHLKLRCFAYFVHTFIWCRVMDTRYNY